MVVLWGPYRFGGLRNQSMACNACCNLTPRKTLHVKTWFVVQSCVCSKEIRFVLFVVLSCPCQSSLRVLQSSWN